MVKLGLLKDLKAYFRKNNLPDTTMFLCKTDAEDSFQTAVKRLRAEGMGATQLPILPNGKPSIFVANLEKDWIFAIFSILHVEKHMPINGRINYYTYVNLGFYLFEKFNIRWKLCQIWTQKDVELTDTGEVEDKAEANLVSAKALSLAKRVSMAGDKDINGIKNFIQESLFGA